MTSAEQAKERLLWCVSQRRNGGAWVEVGYEIIEIVSFDTYDCLSPSLYVPGLPNRYRWRYA